MLRLLAFAVLLLPFVSVHRAAAGERAQREAQAKQLVSEALYREIYGDVEDRERLLERAAELAPYLKEVRWHRGEVRFQDRWQPAGEVAASLPEQSRWKAYEQKRGEVPKTLAGQFALANWCRDHQMPEQERAHLVAALEFAPDHADIRRRLGFQRINDRWVSHQQLAAAREQAGSLRLALKEWQPLLETLRRDLNHSSELRRQKAAERLTAIDDPQAIPAMEVVLAADSEATAKMVVTTIAAMPSREAAASLARHAVLSPWQSVREEAAQRLQSWDREFYVPDLLASMYSPVSSQVRVARGDDGQLVYRHAFYREGQDERQLLVLDTEFHRVPRGGGDRRDSLRRAVGQLSTSAFQREVQVGRQNLLTHRLNERIAEALKTATGEDRPAEPNEWWQWWNDENEVFVEGEKTLQTSYRSEQLAVVDRPVTEGFSGGGQTRGDCFAAGTPVWTATGLKAIERIEVGDLVLSQDPESGELAYKPVLDTTVRPRGPLVRVTIGEEQFETSGGHLFWVSGEGWVKSRELEPGMEIHTPGGTRIVRDRQSGSEQETYNLVVADFSTYFVGPDKLLSHDNTIRRPTERVVPGLVTK